MTRTLEHSSLFGTWKIQVIAAWTIQVKSGILQEWLLRSAYQTFCPVGAALNVVGERWALLIVRDLFLGPRRYSELLKGLGGIPTDILAARLRTLQEQGVVQTGRERARPAV